MSKQVLTMPTEGQFVAVWIGFDKVWSDTYKWEENSLLVYSTVRDRWEEETDVDNVKFLTSKEGIKFFCSLIL
ncbi:hypothetical protein AAM22_gp58 [Pantoea phage vB_PagM_AAM22]|nr:hypothetical protein AAM22_gp58 [Pantoea phage vB_PagM_AAM22]